LQQGKKKQKHNSKAMVTIHSVIPEAENQEVSLTEIPI
jgi:hypothetical protein